MDFSVSNLNWLRDDEAVSRTETNRIKRAKADAQKAKETEPTGEDDEEDQVDQSRVDYEYSPTNDTPLDPALGGQQINPDSDEYFASRLQQATSALPPPAAMMAGAPPIGAPDGYAAVAAAGYIPPAAQMYGQDENGYNYPAPYRTGSVEPMHRDSEDHVSISEFNKRKRGNEDDGEFEDINMTKGKKAKKPRLSAAGFRSLDLADSEQVSSAAKGGVQRQFEKEKERKALDRAKAQGRFIMMQAALKGKKRIVKLSIPGPSLAQLLAERTAEAARMAQAALVAGGEEADADHEVDDAAAQQTNGVEPEDLLKSDVAPKKTDNQKEYQKQREQAGLVITSKTKKALIPLSRDENYEAYRPERKNPGVKSAAGSKAKRKTTRPQVEYEEVDVGSDDDDELFVSNGAPTSQKRRSFRRAEDDEDFPASLPENFRDSNPTYRTRTKPAVASSSRPAGKRPSMRPHEAETIPDDEDADADADADADDSNQGTPVGLPSTSPGFNAVNGTTAVPKKSSLSKSQTGTPTAAAQRQHAMEEDNRRAKLAALSMSGLDARAGAPKRKSVHFSTSTPQNGGNNVSMAEGLESSDDEVESVPAKNGVR